MGDSREPKFIVWSQHWVGYKPRKFGSYETLEEAESVAEKLNASPSARWYHYSVEEIANG